ncbi:M24 family metallopeptidase [Amycolatopsis nigrescens]|uniref:M24 family metallopeptidase n=1 Tax=Amycolatopsis nigrescens TaxID=381445 RepID=UPI001B7FE8E5|nr:Xaa-Pro peptidase family protein [Amycolatopsis nigrescens]
MNRIARRMDELGLDAIVATTFENVFYLTGIASVTMEVVPHVGQCYAVLTRDRPAHPRLVSTRCDMDQFLDALPELDEIVGYGSFFREEESAAGLTGELERLRQVTETGPRPATALDGLVHALRSAGVAGGRIAVDEGSVPHGFLDELAGQLPGARIVTGAETLRWVRKVKTEPELRRLAGSAAVTEQGIRAAIALARPGVTELELVREFERTVAGAGGRPKFTLVKFGAAGVAGQTAPRGDVPLRAGDAIWMDVGCVYQGYWSDIARVHSFGEPSDKLAKYHAAVLAGQERAIRDTRPGMSGREVFELTVEAVRESGMPHYRRQNVGHGIGVEIYDHVLLTPTTEELLEEDTVVNIETPYHEFGFGVVQAEDPFVLRGGGNELLTTLPRELAVLPVR